MDVVAVLPERLKIVIGDPGRELAAWKSLDFSNGFTKCQRQSELESVLGSPVQFFASSSSDSGAIADSS